MEVVGEAFLSAAVELLLSKLSSSVSEWLKLPEKLRAELQNWRNLLPNIRAVLEDAEEKQGRHDPVKLWLADLKDLCYDVEDILEVVDINAKRSEASTSNPQKLIFPKLFNKVGRLTAKGERKMAPRVKDITARLRGIEANISSLNLVSSAMRTGDTPHRVTTERLPTTPVPEQHVFGRENDKEAILKILLSDEGNHEPYSVIPIVGMGGIGKTTLARFIYNDDKLKGRFGLQAWVCVSEDFDVYRITRAILEQVPMGNCDKKELTPLQKELQDKLSGKKFLLVLDDIWKEDYESWENLQRPFLAGAPGSKIIITTRNKDIVRTIRGDDKVPDLSLLEDDACLSLFAQIALGPKNFDAYPYLKGVGEEIVKKCSGLPLAIKTLSGLLRGKVDRASWENILNSEIWDLPNGSDSILPALKLSYNHLSSHLKRCFAYCSIFPKNYEFDEGELVLLWMAEGFLQPPQRNECFRDLLSRAFFQQSSRNESLFVMHDLMVDLALHVAGDTCCTLELDGKISNVSFQKARHLSFSCEYGVSRRFEFLEKKKNLRTFLRLRNFGSWYSWCYLSNTVLQDLMKNLKCLRVLSLQKYNITKLPDQIGDLKHLRFINLSGTEIERLPESVGYLLYLQTLLLRNCDRFSQLPTTIGNLLDLQHLDIAQTECLKELPSEISKLTSLVTLSKFIVGNARGPRVNDLKNLSSLQGQLSILDLQNVAATNEAKEANLSEIEGLDDLSLEWSFDSLKNPNEISELQVLSWLEPHRGLKRLTINCFGGLEFPPWIGDPSFSNLEFLKLNNCQKSISLPSLQRLPRLKKLIITGLHAIQTMMLDGDNSSSSWSFPSLESLELQDCPILKGKFPKCIPVLKKLKIVGCPELIRSPVSLPSLEELCIEKCSEAVLRSMVDLKSLKILRISRISKLIWLPKSCVESLIALEDMEIRECNELTRLWEEGANMENLACLKMMTIKKCRLLVSLKGKEQGFLPNSVQTLSIEDCEALESLPSEIMMMVRLEKLWIIECPALRMFPKLPTTLKILQIRKCEKLESLPEGILMNNGDARPVFHLAKLEIVSCPCLESFPGGHLPNSLKILIVRCCKRLEFIPQRMLQYCTEIKYIHIDGSDQYYSSYIQRDKRPSLGITNLDGLESLCLFIPKLKILTIQKCKNLKSLPDKLQDLNSLDELEIRDCPGIESIPDGRLPPNLTSLKIFDCSRIQSIPDGGLPPNLTEFVIIRCPEIKSIPSCGFPPNLGKLAIDCKNLKKPPMQEWGLSRLTSLLTFNIGWICPPDNVLPTSLTRLTVNYVENMKSMPKEALPASLQDLSIWDCDFDFQSLPEGGLPPSLQDLDIAACPNFRSLPKEGLPPSLQKLNISYCRNFWSLPNKGLPPSLQKLNISKCRNFRSLPKKGLPPSLQVLDISECRNFRSLPKEGLPPSLQVLDISYCRNFQSLPKKDLPPLLERLRIVGCPLLQRRLCIEEEGDYWPLIAHIPCIEVEDDESDIGSDESDTSSGESDTSSETKQQLCSCFKTV